MKKVILMTVLGVVLGLQQSQAQTSSMSGFRRNFAIVAFAGIGGAVLGLSTLSFYGTPQDHVDNITTGFLFGLAGGMVYVVSDSAKAGGNMTTDSYTLIDNPRRSLPQVGIIRVPIYVAEF